MKEPHEKGLAHHLDPESWVIVREGGGQALTGVPQMGSYLAAATVGHYGYFGVPTNIQLLQSFRFEVGRLWKQALERRSQRTRVSWARMQRLIARWLPPATIKHPWPSERFAVRTRGRSRMR